MNEDLKIAGVNYFAECVLFYPFDYYRDWDLGDPKQLVPGLLENLEIFK